MLEETMEHGSQPINETTPEESPETAPEEAPVDGVDTGEVSEDTEEHGNSAIVL